MKSSCHLTQNPHQIMQQPCPLLPAPNQPQVPPSSQQPYHLPHNMFQTNQHQLSSPKLNSTIVNQVQYYPNQIMSVGSYCQHPQSSPHVPSKYPGQWGSPGENLKEVIVREMPNYKANLQDYSPDEVIFKEGKSKRKRLKALLNYYLIFNFFFLLPISLATVYG